MNMSFTNRKKLPTLNDNIEALEAAEAAAMGIKTTENLNENYNSDEIENLKEINESIETERQKHIIPQQNWNERLEEVHLNAKEIQQFQVHKKHAESELKRIVEISAKKNRGKRIRAQSAYPQKYYPKLYSLYFSQMLMEIMDEHIKNETVGYVFDYNGRSDFVVKAVISKIKSDLKGVSSIIKKPENKN